MLPSAVWLLLLLLLMGGAEATMEDKIPPTMDKDRARICDMAALLVWDASWSSFVRSKPNDDDDDVHRMTMDSKRSNAAV